MTVLQISIERNIFLIVSIDWAWKNVKFITQCKDLADRRMMLLGNRPMSEHILSTANQVFRNCHYLSVTIDLDKKTYKIHIQRTKLTGK